jgi:hypothetical protein
MPFAFEQVALQSQVTNNTPDFVLGIGREYAVVRPRSFE